MNLGLFQLLPRAPAGDDRALVSPPLLRACSSPGSVRRAAAEGMPLLLGTRSAAEIGDFLGLYRQVRADVGVPAPQVEEEIGAAWVLRQVVVATTDAAACTAAGDGMAPGSCVGSPESVARALGELADLGIENVIVWIPDARPAARRESLRLLAREVLPALTGGPAVRAPVPAIAPSPPGSFAVAQDDGLEGSPVTAAQGASHAAPI